jgi:DNA polymerase I
VAARRPLLVIDGDNFAHRAYHSMPKSLKAADGRPINALVGWTNMILNVVAAEQPRAVYVGWDTLGGDAPTYRHELWPAYQAGRVFDRELVTQLDALPGLAAAFGFGTGKREGYEADDFIAAATKAEERAGGTVLILTNDRDAWQLVNEAVTVLAPRKGVSDLVRVGPAEVVERFGVGPELVPDFKALAGDSSDNIPGAKGVGPMGAAQMLQKYGGLEAAIEASAKLFAEAERLLMFREIVRMQDDVAVELPPDREPDFTAGAAELRRLGAAGAADRVEQMAGRMPGV